MESGSSDKRNQRHAEAEARHLIGEAQRILKRKRKSIPEAVRLDVEAAVGDVESAMNGRSAEELRRSVGKLDEKMDEHLSFARKSTVREYVESIGVAIAIALLLRTFIVEAFQIPSGSMIPTLQIGDHIFVSKFAYGISNPFGDKRLVSFGLPKRGDIIVFKFPKDQQTDYIKRVVALPGETVELRKSEIFINGRPMHLELSGRVPCPDDEGPRIDGHPAEGDDCELWTEDLDGKVHPAKHRLGSRSDVRPTVIPDGHVFVMGDNRDNSNDSRAWGTVPLDLVKGRALIVWWSRGPIGSEGVWNKVRDWFGAIRWRRFFTIVK
jgi:signal peptidase I